MKKNIPPVDGKNYYFNEKTQAWLEVQLDEHGFELIPERIEALKPHSSWVRNSDNTSWVAPIEHPGDSIDENGWVDSYFIWDESSISWIEIHTRPYPSWVRDSHGSWVAPVAKQEDGVDRVWHEGAHKWVRNPEALGKYGAIWNQETEDFVSALELRGFTDTGSSIDASWETQEWLSWTQGEDGRWRAPLPYPYTGKLSYEWDEYEQEWFDMAPEISPYDLPHVRIEREKFTELEQVQPTKEVTDGFPGDI